MHLLTSYNLTIMTCLVTDKSGSSLAQLKVGFHEDIQSNVLATDDKEISLQKVIPSGLSDPKQDPSSGQVGEHRRPSSSGKDSVTKQSLPSDAATSGTEHLSTTGESQTR